MPTDINKRNSPFSFIDTTKELDNSDINSRFNNTFVDYKYKIFFSKSLKSIKSDELLFTNFIKSTNKKEFFILKFLYENLEHIETNIENYFDMSEMRNSNIAKIERLKKIFYLSTNKRIKDITKLYKCKYLARRKQKYIPLRIFTKKQNNKLIVYLIDLYHLAWTATDKYGKDDPEGIYKHCKDYSLCISKIIESF